jgi:hypothetical protein
MIYKTVSSKTVIAKMFRDLKPQSQDWVADSMEWIGEALEYIGFHAGFEKKSTSLQVNSFRAALPSDIYELSSVEKDGRALVYTSGSRNFEPANLTIERMRHPERTYSLNPNYIIAGFESGALTLNYLAFPLDEEGFPMIPDNIYYKQALQWYIIRQMIMGGYKHPSFNYQFADGKWGHYCVAAQNDAAFPSVDKTQSFLNGWLRLTPNVQLQDEFFNGTK